MCAAPRPIQPSHPTLPNPTQPRPCHHPPPPHPQALDFLREDCKHINDFFRRAGVATLSVREAFDFAVDPSINDGNVDAELERLSEVAARCVGLGGRVGGQRRRVGVSGRAGVGGWGWG